MNVHDFIDNYDIPGLNQFIHLKNSYEINKPNYDGIYPIEYVISKFDPLKHNIKTHLIFIQILLNKGCDFDKDMLKEIIDEQQDEKIKEFISKVLEMKPHASKDRFARYENKHIKQINQNKSRNIKQDIMLKSNYSDQELLQLQQHAEKHGILTKPNNHLALRIINHLERLLEQYGHYN